MSNERDACPLPLRTTARAGASLLLIAAAALCQVPRGGWVIATDHTELVVLDGNFVPIGWGLGSGGGSVTVDDQGLIFHAFSNEILRRRYDPTQYPGSRLGPPFVLVPPGPAVYYMGLAVTRDRLWFIQLDGSIAHIDKVTANQSPTFIGNVRTAGGITGQVRSICTDGREVFFSVVVTASDTHHVFAVDLRSTPLSVRRVASLPIGPVAKLPTVAIGRDGNLVVMDPDFLYRVDTLTGAVTFVEPNPLGGPGGTNYFPVAYDPWSDIVAMLGPNHSQTYSRVLTSGAFALSYGLFGDTALAITTTSEQPFELFGKGCTNGLGREPRLGWQGLPLQGNTFTLKLRQAEPSGFSMFWLGLSDTFWFPVGPLPFDAAPFGAPGCRLLVSADMPYPVFVDGSGQASLGVAVPVNPALHGFEVFAQTASTSGGNSLGFATSDAVVIRLR